MKSRQMEQSILYYFSTLLLAVVLSDPSLLAMVLLDLVQATAHQLTLMLFAPLARPRLT